MDMDIWQLRLIVFRADRGWFFYMLAAPTATEGAVMVMTDPSKPCDLPQCPQEGAEQYHQPTPRDLVLMDEFRQSLADREKDLAELERITGEEGPTSKRASIVGAVLRGVDHQDLGGLRFQLTDQTAARHRGA